MAKGLEDTTFYVFNRLTSLNEVGGDAGRFGISVDDFHSFNEHRAKHYPQTLNATATHDTKRGEDVRARISVLSEMPEVWQRHLELWHEQNNRLKKQSKARKCRAAIANIFSIKRSSAHGRLTSESAANSSSV